MYSWSVVSDVSIRFHRGAANHFPALLIAARIVFQIVKVPALRDLETVGAKLALGEPVAEPAHAGRICCRRVIARRDRPLRELAYQLRLFAFPELDRWLRDAGFTDVHAFGDEGEVFRVDSRRLIVTARR